MAFRDLIPWGRNGNQAARTSYSGGTQNPFLALHRDVNRLFDEAFRSFDTPAFGGLGSWMDTSWANWPNVEIAETDKEIKIVAEVPGLEEKDVEVLLEDNVLTLRGEKRSETNDQARQFSERFYGHFERRIPIDAEVEEDSVAASFKNGVLTVTLPKNPQAQSRVKRIAINGRN
jgi:HSP20 family protein